MAFECVFLLCSIILEWCIKIFEKYEKYFRTWQNPTKKKKIVEKGREGTWFVPAWRGTQEQWTFLSKNRSMWQGPKGAKWEEGNPFQMQSLLSVSLKPTAVHTAGNPEELFAQVHVVLRVLVCSLGKKHCCICARRDCINKEASLRPLGNSLPTLRSELLNWRKFCLIMHARTQCYRSSWHNIYTIKRINPDVRRISVI